MTNTTNTNLTFQGNPLKVTGSELKVGQPMPAFQLTGTSMEPVTSEQFKGKALIVSVVPSLDTPVCAVQTKRFNSEAANLGSDVAILTVSMDLPFAQKRWCGAEGVKSVLTASDFKERTFGKNFGVLLTDLGILARALFVVDKTGTIRHVEYVKELSHEPDYAAALAVTKQL